MSIPGYTVHLPPKLPESICGICLHPFLAEEQPDNPPISHNDQDESGKKHPFHKRCLRAYVESLNRSNFDCPTCRMRLDSSPILEEGSSLCLRVLKKLSTSIVQPFFGGALAIGGTLGLVAVIGIICVVPSIAILIGLETLGCSGQKAQIVTGICVGLGAWALAQKLVARLEKAKYMSNDLN